MSFSFNFRFLFLAVLGLSIRKYFVRFEAVAAISTEPAVFWDVMPCSLIEGSPGNVGSRATAPTDFFFFFAKWFALSTCEVTRFLMISDRQGSKIAVI
jgi:hypothetical protein